MTDSYVVYIQVSFMNPINVCILYYIKHDLACVPNEDNLKLQ